jgi:hypothetical protein
LEQLKGLGLPVSFALDHMYNVVNEFGVFLRVDKTLAKAPNPQTPLRELCYERGKILRTLSSGSEAPTSAQHRTTAPPLRHRAVDLLNTKVKEQLPALHSLARNLLGRISGMK